MAGLLYKDFVAIRGKIYVIGAVLMLLAAWILRVLTNTDEMELLLVLTAFCLIIALFFLVDNTIEINVLQVDEVKKQKQYCISLPVTKKKYVATKYVFLLITLYFIQAFCVVLCNILIIDYRTIVCEQLLSILASLVPIMASMMLCLLAIELPFFIGFGYKKGNVLKQSIIVLLFFAVMVYMMFGNLNIFHNASIDTAVEWVEKNQNFISILQVLSPCITLLIYYISYRISCALFERREFEDD